MVRTFCIMFHIPATAHRDLPAGFCRRASPRHRGARRARSTPAPNRRRIARHGSRRSSNPGTWSTDPGHHHCPADNRNSPLQAQRQSTPRSGQRLLLNGILLICKSPQVNSHPWRIGCQIWSSDWKTITSNTTENAMFHVNPIRPSVSSLPPNLPSTIPVDIENLESRQLYSVSLAEAAIPGSTAMRERQFCLPAATRSTSASQDHPSS